MLVKSDQSVAGNSRLPSVKSHKIATKQDVSSLLFCNSVIRYFDSFESLAGIQFRAELAISHNNRSGCNQYLQLCGYLS